MLLFFSPFAFLMLQTLWQPYYKLKYSIYIFLLQGTEKYRLKGIVWYFINVCSFLLFLLINLCFNTLFIIKLNCFFHSKMLIFKMLKKFSISEVKYRKYILITQKHKNKTWRVLNLFLLLLFLYLLCKYYANWL